jgi:hypothetical protein
MTFYILLFITAAPHDLRLYIPTRLFYASNISCLPSDESVVDVDYLYIWSPSIHQADRGVEGSGQKYNKTININYKTVINLQIIELVDFVAISGSNGMCLCKSMWKNIVLKLFVEHVCK